MPLNRVQRRQLVALIAQGVVQPATEPWQRDDAQFFKAHPRRSFRARDVFPGEFPDCDADFVLVEKRAPRERARMPFRLLEIAPDLVGAMQALARAALAGDEAACRALFWFPKGRAVEHAEAAALIAAGLAAPVTSNAEN